MKKEQLYKSVAILSILATGTVMSTNVKASTVSNDPKVATVTSATPKAVDEPAVTSTSGVDGTVKWNIDDNGVLTFQAGELGPSMVENTIIPRGWNADKSKITKIIFTGKVTLPADSSYLFDNMTNLSEVVNSTNIDSSKVTNMMGLFDSDSSLNT